LINTTIVVTDVNAPLTIEAGGLSIYGNKTASLAIANYETDSSIYICIPTQQ
jgi:hypothetical protein